MHTKEDSNYLVNKVTCFVYLYNPALMIYSRYMFLLDEIFPFTFIRHTHAILHSAKGFCQRWKKKTNIYICTNKDEKQYFILLLINTLKMSEHHQMFSMVLTNYQKYTQRFMCLLTQNKVFYYFDTCQWQNYTLVGYTDENKLNNTLIQLILL